MKGFASYHPAALLLYFLSAALLTMLTLHPVLLVLSFLGALSLLLLEQGLAVCRKLLYYLPFLFIMAAANPLFNQQGDHILFRLGAFSYTLESFFYGLAVGIMLVDVMLWFSGYSRMMTADKTLYLFGGAFPRLSLVLSSAMRFVPLFTRQAGAVHDAQKAMGMYAGGSRTDKLRGALRSFSALFSWSLENAVDTADAMEARGYGLPGGSRMDARRLRLRDNLCIGFSLLLLCVCLAEIFARQAAAFDYFPRFARQAAGPETFLLYICAGFLFFLPCLILLKERLHWKLLQSRI